MKPEDKSIKATKKLCWYNKETAEHWRTSNETQRVTEKSLFLIFRLWDEADVKDLSTICAQLDWSHTQKPATLHI